MIDWINDSSKKTAAPLPFRIEDSGLSDKEGVGELNGFKKSKIKDDDEELIQTAALNEEYKAYNSNPATFTTRRLCKTFHFVRIRRRSKNKTGVPDGS
ncbi:MAG: hypothetical protein LAT67_14405, partial [Balneolales bacterium]|nr:hypothetical protein [Balneolales bacterium]